MTDILDYIREELGEDPRSAVEEFAGPSDLPIGNLQSLFKVENQYGECEYR